MSHLTTNALKYFCVNEETKAFFFQFESIIIIVLEYLCYGSTAIINILLFDFCDRLQNSDSDVHRNG